MAEELIARLRAHTRGRLPVILVFGLFALLASAACSSSDDETTTPTSAAEATVTATSSAAVPTTAAETSTPEGTTEPAMVEALAISVTDGDLGPYLAGPDGMTLYVFLRDEPGTSNCSGGCLDNWPPLLTEEGQSIEADPAATGTFSHIETPSGEQVTYNDAPLYYFAADEAAGDTEGQNVGGVWFVARPETASTQVVGVRDDGSESAPYLVGPTGMTLYTFANDEPGVSNCRGGCLERWPALTVPEGMDPTAVSSATGELGVVVRDDDGTRQVTYEGMPLYYFAADEQPGDTSGDGVGDVWFLATPGAGSSAAATNEAGY